MPRGRPRKKPDTDPVTIDSVIPEPEPAKPLETVEPELGDEYSGPEVDDVIVATTASGASFHGRVVHRSGSLCWVQASGVMVVVNLDNILSIKTVSRSSGPKENFLIKGRVYCFVSMNGQVTGTLERLTDKYAILVDGTLVNLKTVEYMM